MYLLFVDMIIELITHYQTHTFETPFSHSPQVNSSPGIETTKHAFIMIDY